MGAGLGALRIGESITPFAGAFRERTIEWVRYVTHGHVERAQALLGPGTLAARESALAIINQRVAREALLMAYSDTFLVAGVAMLACVLSA